MKKLVVIILACALMLSVIPAFAAEKSEEKTIFQIAGDSIENVKSTQGKPSHKVDIFQNINDTIATLGQASLNAKKLSLRDNKQEAARRSGIK